jgi:hypothetical protein
VSFAAKRDAEITAMTARLAKALTTGCPPDVRLPVLRVIEGGRSVPKVD